MTGPLRFARALAPAMLVGLLCGAAATATTIPGSPPRIAPPCSPDGNCLPRYETWGWYETRWRQFPGDVVGGPPTKAVDEEPGKDDQIGGPQLPSPAEEGTVGPKPRTGAGVAPNGAAPADAAPAGEAPVDAIPAPTFEPAPGVGPAPGGEPAPAAVPDPLDPFGAAPPAPPSWMQQPIHSAMFEPLPTMPLPAVGVAMPTATEAKAAPAPITHGPNLNDDDAPPALPASLQDALSGSTAPRPAWSAEAATTTLMQPPSVRPQARSAVDRRVVPASAQMPLGIQLINPAAAIAVEPGDDGLQQAIYFEATDLPAELPPAAPTN